MDGEVYQVLEFQHVKTGRGGAFVRTRLKNVFTGVIRDVTLNPNEKVGRASIETKEMQYLYNDGELYHFMDLENYEQLPLSKEAIEEKTKYIKENDSVTLRFYKGNPFEVLPP